MDPFHILRGGGPIESIAKVPGDKVAVWHWERRAGRQALCRTKRRRPGDARVTGSGRCARLSGWRRAQGYEGFVSLELFNPGLWAEDPADVARIGLEKMRAYFARLSVC